MSERWTQEEIDHFNKVLDRSRKTLERGAKIHVLAMLVLGFALGAIICGLIHQ